MHVFYECAILLSVSYAVFRAVHSIYTGDEVK